LKAKGLQIEFSKFHNVKKSTFSKRKKRRKKDFLEDEYLFLEKVTNVKSVKSICVKAKSCCGIREKEHAIY